MAKQLKNNAVQERNRRLIRLSGEMKLGGIVRYRAIHDFRTNTPFREYVSSFQRVFKTREALADFHGEAFPTTVDGLYSVAPPRIKNSALGEILWAVGRVLQFKEELKKFVELRQKLEVATISDDALGAWEILNEVEHLFGISVWLLQNRLAVKVLPSGTELAKQVAAGDAVQGLVEGSPMLNVLMNYARKRIDGAVLRENLKSELQTGFSTRPELLEYFQTKLFDITNSVGTNVSSILFYDSQASLVDHYDTLVMTLQSVAADARIPLEFRPTLARHLHEVYRATSDIRLLGVLRSLGWATPMIPEMWSDDERHKIIEAYSSGDYAEAFRRAETYIAAHPLDMAIRVLSVKAGLYLNNSSEADGSLWSLIAADMREIFSLSNDFYSAAYSLFSMADKYYDHSWMMYLRLTVMYEIRAESQKFPPPWMKDLYVHDPCITPFSAVAASDDARKEIIDNQELRKLYPVTFRSLDSLLAGQRDSSMSDERADRYLARHFLANGQYSAASELYERSLSRLDGAEWLRCAGGASLALAEQGRLRDAVDLAVSAYMNKKVAPTLLPLQELVAHLKDAAKWPVSLNLCILFDLHRTYSNEDSLSELRYAFELFQVQEEIDSPEKLAGMEAKLGQQYITYYLDKVWRPEIMRQTVLFDGAQEIEDERIKVCGTLAKVDPENSRKYLDEMATRVKQSEIAKATSLVEKSIVYVDIEAIKRSLKAKLGNSYLQYKNSTLQSEKAIDPLVEKISEVLAASPTHSMATLLSGLHIFGHHEKMTAADRQFASIFSEVTNEFLRGDHGLNAYLSTRVRHGKLINALRKGVMDEAIVTSKDTNNAYLENEIWRQKAIERGVSWPLVCDALKVFSNDFDNILVYVRDELIQIQIIQGLVGSGENKNGLFVYSSSHLERMLVQGYDLAYKELDELVAKCIDTLWEKTDLNLNTVRQNLDKDIRERLLQAFDQLTSKLSAVDFGELFNAIARSRTSTQASLDTVISWFKRSEVFDRADFAVDLPPRIAFNVVKQTMSIPMNWDGPRLINRTVDDMLPGRALDGLTDIFYVLMENSVKYSAGGQIDVEVLTSFQRGEYLCKFSSSAAPPSEGDIARVGTLRESLLTPESRRLAQSEGKSGFRKIWIALDNPLYREPTLKFGHLPNGRFEVDISFKVKNENTVH